MASLLIHLPPIPILQHLITLLILIQIPPYLSSYDDDYKACANLISCGNIKNMGFPFWGENRPRECGHPLMQLICQNDISYVTIKGVMYKVLEANTEEHTLRITRVDYLQGLCPSKLVNTSLDTELFVYGSADYKNLTLFYGCPPPNYWPPTNGSLPCNGGYVYPQFGSSLPPSVFCKASVVVPVPPSLIDINDFNQVHKAIIDGFMVRWIGIEECDKCEILGGVCGVKWYSNPTTCYCRDGPCSNFLPDAKTPSQSPPVAKGGLKR